MHNETVIFRDFFFDGCAHTIQSAYAALTESVASTTDHAFINWQQEEYTFNRLFVGPQHIEAPPYASVWLGTQGLLMDEHTLEVRELYELLHLVVTPGMPEDYLPLELDAYTALMQLKTQAQTADEVKALQEVLHWLVCIHWQLWLKPFVAQILNYPTLTPAIKTIITRLQQWLSQQIHVVFEASGDLKIISHDQEGVKHERSQSAT